MIEDKQEAMEGIIRMHLSSWRAAPSSPPSLVAIPTEATE